MPTPDDRTIVELDSRGRASIGKHTNGRRHYFLDVDKDGTITLTPAVVMTETEAALARNPELTARIEHFLEHPEDGVRRERPTHHDRKPTEAGTVRTKADADLLQSLGGPDTHPSTPVERQNWIYALIETSGGAMKVDDIVTKTHEAGYNFSRTQITDCLAYFVRCGRIQDGSEPDLYELVQPRAAWKKRIYEILVEAKAPMTTPDIWGELRRSQIGTPKRLDVATLLTELLMEQRAAELEPGTFQALPPKTSTQA
jgi:hypothetical protein